MEQGNSSAGAWLRFLVVFYAGLVGAQALMKTTGVMVNMVDDLGISMSLAGFLMTGAGAGATVIVLFGTGIMQRVGAFKVMLVAMAFAFVGSLGGYFLIDNYPALMAARVVDGGAYGLVMAAGPTLIAELFPAEKRGLPNSLFVLTIAFGLAVILNAENAITASAGWRLSWVFCAVQAAVAFALVLLFLRMPAGAGLEDEQGATDGGHAPTMAEGLKAAGPWCIMVIVCVYATVNGFETTFYPTYLQNDLHMDQAAANAATTVASYASIVGALVVGFALGKVPVARRALALLVVTVLFAVAGSALFMLPGAAVVVPFLAVYGFVQQMQAPVMLTLLPDVSVPGAVAVSMGLYSAGMSLGGLVSSFAGGVFVDAFGSFGSLTGLIVGMLAVSIAACVVVMRAANKMGS